MMSSTRSTPRPSVSSHGARDEVLGSVVDARIGAQRDAPPNLLEAPRGDENPAAALPCQLNCRSADTASAAVDEHGLAVLQPAPREEGIVSGDEDFGDPARIDHVDVVRNQDGLRCAHRYELRIGATFDEEHDAIPD